MENTYKDIDLEEQKANQEFEAIRQRLSAIAAQKDKAKEDSINAQKQERLDLLENAKKFRNEANEAAKTNDFARALQLRGFAEDSEKQAREMIIEGEKIEDLNTETLPIFGIGMSLKKVMVLLLAIVTALYFACGYINHLVELGEKSISISIGAEWIHAIQTTQFWALAWLLCFGMLSLTFRAISKFMNPKNDPDFDFTTKLFTECSSQFQIIVSLVLLLSMLFSWCLVYLHKAVANAG